MRLFVLRSGAGEGGGEAPALSCVFFFSAFIFFHYFISLSPPPPPLHLLGSFSAIPRGAEGLEVRGRLRFCGGNVGGEPHAGTRPILLPQERQDSAEPPSFLSPPHGSFKRKARLYLLAPRFPPQSGLWRLEGFGKSSLFVAGAVFPPWPWCFRSAQLRPRVVRGLWGMLPAASRQLPAFRAEGDFPPPSFCLLLCRCHLPFLEVET